jgi:21S rRNA (uridine2791-2'-O)-methyltransferase
MAALTFSFDTLKTGGHFLCKFYQGSEEKAFETKLKRLFAKVHREKPDSSRTVCQSQVDPVNSILTLTRSQKRRTL